LSVTIGTKLGSYEITALLGKGGMGEVYRARDTKLKREVAIKILPEEFSSDADRVIRFQREAEVLASLNHSNIAAIYDLQEAASSRFFVLELVEGETLAGRIARGAIPIDETLSIAKGICGALEAAHEKRIIHRDLKPANIKITHQGRVKVLDFGLAKLFATDDSPSSPSDSPTLLSISAGVILGTASYMSPEQARGQTVDAQSDIWAFGCLIYEMLTGRQAFAGETTTDILSGIVRIDPDWTLLPADTPQLLRLLLRQCLQKNRAARLHHIGDARIQLEAAAIDTASAAAATAVVEGKKRRPLQWIASIAVLVAMAAGLVRYLQEVPTDRRALRFSIPWPEKALPYLSPIEPFPSISHDGRTAAFIATSDGIQHVWLRSFDSLDAKPLAGTEGAGYFPFFSPDDRFIGFFAQGKLKKIGVAGGPARVISDARGGFAGAWNRDGVIIFSIIPEGGLYRISADGGNVEPLTTPDASRHETSHISPEFLPDGDHFLFLSRTASTDTYAIMARSLRSKEIRFVLNANSFARYDSGHLLYVRDGILTAQRFDASKLRITSDAVTVAEQIPGLLGAYSFSVSGNGTLIYRTRSVAGNRRLQWFDRSGKSLGSVGPAGAYRNPELSPDGKRIAVEVTDPQTQNDDIWIIDVATGVPNRWTFEPGFDMYPIWSATGEQIVFGTSRNGAENIYLKGTSGGAEELIFKGAAIPRDWSRDNRFLVYGVGPSSQLMVLPLIGDRKPFPYLPYSTGYGQARISPDGKWLAFYSSESGRSEVYVQNFPVPSEKYQISTNGGISPRWRRDGKEIFYLAPDRKLVAVPLRTTDQGVEVSAASVLFGLVDTGPDTNAYGGRQQYDVTADGRRFLVNVAADEKAATGMTVVSNWLATIKR